MPSLIGQQTITVHILSNVSRSKDSQVMKFDQLIDYNIENNFFQKTDNRCGGEARIRRFYKK